MGGVAAAGADLFLGWLNAGRGSNYETAGADDWHVARDGERTLSISVGSLFENVPDGEWARRCKAAGKDVERLISGPLTVWIPPTADLPHGDRTDFIHRIADSVSALEPGQRGQVEFPVTLTLKKTGSEASYVQVTGGLAPHWARLTGRAYGQYLLDTTPIHRLPEPESRVADLLDWVALLGNGMKPGSSSDFKAEDAWTITRPTKGKGCILAGADPSTDPTNGTSVRRLLRDALRASTAQQGSPGTARALVLVGVFRTLDEESATIALRSCDPGMYRDFDVICLVADGRCKAIYGPRDGRL